MTSALAQPPPGSTASGAGPSTGAAELAFDGATKAYGDAPPAVDGRSSTSFGRTELRPAMRAMNRAVAIDKQSPADVAEAFLRANGLA